MLSVIVLLIGTVRDPRDRCWRVIRGAAARYLLITGVVYAVLLAEADVVLTDRLINAVALRILPIVMVLDRSLIPVPLGITRTLIVGWLIRRLRPVNRGPRRSRRTGRPAMRANPAA
ncbi:hypothetical protein ACIBJI_07515 [Nocardia sp. NPDC050408]|uniref:hypothetical protein n=1 Tax=unclassified Nocardia TaxID=2637762 RepID=UPI00344AAF20